LALESSAEASPIEEPDSAELEPSAFVPSDESEPDASSDAPPSCEDAPPPPLEPHATTAPASARRPMARFEARVTDISS
jgi:hypothetical protein